MLRKDFIKTSGLFAGAALAMPRQLFSRSLAGYENAVRIGIIGCGDRGLGLLSGMQELKAGFSFVAACDILEFRREEARAKDETGTLKIYSDYRQVLGNKSIDAVIIATPLYNHYEIAAASLLAGKHVYLEKTMTYDIDEAKKLVALAAKYPKLVLQVGHQYRYTPLYFRVKEMIEKGYLGDVTQIDCRWDRNWNWRRPVPAGYTDEQINWRMYKKYSGGLPAELLSHQVDFVNWAFGTHPDEIMGTGGIDHFKDGRETYDNVQAVLRYNDKGMIGNFGATCANAREGYIFKIKGTKGMVSLLPGDGIFYPEAATRKELETVDGVSGATRIEWNNDGGIPIMREKQKDGTWYALEEFYTAIQTGSKPVSDVMTGATTAVCVHLINEAIFGHKIMSWKPEYNFK